MAVVRGGRRRPHKQMGRGSVAKAYRSAMRTLAMQGIGHNANGERTPGSVSPDAKSQMGVHAFFGSKMAVATGYRHHKRRKSAEAEE